MNNIVINLYIVGAKKLYTCNLSLNLSLMDNMTLIYTLIKEDIDNEFILDKHILIYENISNRKLNLFIKLKELNILENSILIVY